jgi:TonB family protein
MKPFIQSPIARSAAQQQFPAASTQQFAQFAKATVRPSAINSATKDIRRGIRTTAFHAIASAFVCIMLTGSAFAQTTPASQGEVKTFDAKTAQQQSALSVNSVGVSPESAAKADGKAETTFVDEISQTTYVPAQFNRRELLQRLRYPLSALRLGKEGTVQVVVYLNADGSITNVNFIGENQQLPNELVTTAYNAVKQCAFAPALRNSKPVSSVVVIPVKFIL